MQWIALNDDKDLMKTGGNKRMKYSIKSSKQLTEASNFKVKQ